MVAAFLGEPGGAHLVTVGGQGGQGLYEASPVTLLWVVAVDGQVWSVAEDVAHESREGPLGSQLHEGAYALPVHGFHDGDKLDGAGHLLGQEIHDRFARLRVEICSHVRVDGQRGNADVAAIEHLAQGLGGGGHDPGMEGVRHGNGACLDPAGFNEFDGPSHRFARSGDHRLVRAVFVGGDHVAVHFRDEFFGALGISRHHGHEARVSSLGHCGGHLLAPGCHHPQGVIESHDPGSHAGTVFPQGMAGDRVWIQSKPSQNRQDRRVRREYRGLGDGSVAQGRLGGRRGIGAFTEVFGARRTEHEVRQGPAQDGLHDFVRPADHGRGLFCSPGQALGHTDILTALTWEEKGQFPGLSFGQEGARAGEFDASLSRFEIRDEAFDALGQFFCGLGGDRRPDLRVCHRGAMAFGHVRQRGPLGELPMCCAKQGQQF